jgi:hypothetical protein
MGSSGQVSVGHTELATMDVLEDGQIDPASSIMLDTCPVGVPVGVAASRGAVVAGV